MRYALILALLAAATLAGSPATLAAPPTTCGGAANTSAPSARISAAISPTPKPAFRAIVERGEKQRPTPSAPLYFLARTLMKTGRFDEASTLLIRIYSLDKAFYDAWNCDFLLGECRKALGR